MSDFSPLNDDHAVEHVTFHVVFDEPVGLEYIAIAQQRHSLWREELPAVQVALNAGEIFPHAVAFSYMRPDGSSAWQLKFEQTGVQVTCRRYTRWAKVWGTAQSLLTRGLAAIATIQADDPLRLGRIRLLVGDRFSAPEDGFDASHLLVKPSKLLPPHIYDVGPMWHSNSGWFEPHSIGTVLQNLNVASARSADEPAPTIHVTIEHLQELRLTAALDCSDLQIPFGMLDTVMEGFHVKNKECILSLLAPKVARRIGLPASVEENADGD